MNRHQRDLDASHPLTTALHPELTPQELKRRQRKGAMAKAAAVIRRYGGGNLPNTQRQPEPLTPKPTLPVAQPVNDPPTATVTRVPGPARRRNTASEPNYLALNGSFRKSASSLISREDVLGADSSHSNSQSSRTSPPALKTEVTTHILDGQKMPAVRRPSDSVALGRNGEQYRERPSFEAHDAFTRSLTSANPLIIPKKPAPKIYPTVGSSQTNNNRESANSHEGGLLRGLAIDEQAQMLERYQRQPEPSTATASTDNRTLAIQEQEKLWKQFSNSNSPINVSAASTGSPRSVARIHSPLEEQSHLWDQITINRNSASTRPALNPLEEQARLLQAFHPKHASTALSAVEEQARILQAFQASRPVNPIEEQAKRLQEIQAAKEKRMMEMVCQMSQSTVPDRRDEEELSLQYIMEMSRREVEAQQEFDDAVLQEALQRSQEDLGVSIQQHLREHERSVDLELRRSIAELACQTSDYV